MTPSDRLVAGLRGDHNRLGIYRQRLAKSVENGGIKIDSVTSALTTLSARDMIDALIGGERDPTVLADLAQDRMRNKVPDLELACGLRPACADVHPAPGIHRPPH
jgi:predicted RNA methylase